MSSLRVAVLAFLFLYTACSRHVSVATVEVIDTSLSITPRAEKAALDAVQGQISHLGRGDSLVLIPITGDAANDAGGRILRLAAPTRREAYDSDLHRFQEQAGKQFAAWVMSLDQHQSRTDILGALDAARQEFSALPSGVNQKLIVVSDFLEDDGTYNFVSVGSMASSARARELATRLREEHEFALQGATICLGRIESNDFASLTSERKQAVQAFWTTYLSKDDGHPELRFDGTGILNGNDGCLTGPNRMVNN